MAIFHVIIDKNKASRKVVERLKKEYPDYYEYHGQEGMFFIRANDLSSEIAMKIGIRGDNKIADAAGAVYKMNKHYSGFTVGDIWEWLGKDDE